MDRLDKNIKSILTKEIDKPQSYYNSIKYALDNKQKNNISQKKFDFTKVVAVSLSTITLTTGMVFATKALYENVWKEPKKVDGYYGENSEYIDSERYGIWTSNNIDLSKTNVISEDEAKEKANGILKKFGYENEVIKSTILVDNPSDTGLFYRLTTENNFLLDIDAKQPENFKIFTNTAYKDISKQRGTKEEIEQVAKNICKKYGYDLSKYNNVEVIYNGEKPENANIWTVTYNKTYNNIVNLTEEIQIGIIPGINELEHFTYTDIAPENTEIIVSEEQAKEIAHIKEKALNIGNIIKDIKTTLAITYMNGYEYLRENDYEQYYEQTHTEKYPVEKIKYYKVEKRRRQVWLVNLQFEINENSKIQERSFTYFIDTTTGEIVGGM